MGKKKKKNKNKKNWTAEQMNARLRGDHRFKLITACEGRKQPVYTSQLQVMWRNVMNNNRVGE